MKPSSAQDAISYHPGQLVLKQIQRVGLGSLAGAIALGMMNVRSAVAQNAITFLEAPYRQGSSKTVSTTIASPSAGGIGAVNAAATLNFGVSIDNDRYARTFGIAPSSGVKIFNFSRLFDNIYIRRNTATPLISIVDPTKAESPTNPLVTPDPNRQLAFFDRFSLPNGTIFNLKSSSVDTMESILLSQTINRGTDNTFVNKGNGNGNNNNIERIDFVSPAGIKAPNASYINDIGFLILERNGNDLVKIAAITGLDSSGNPSNYGPMVTSGAASSDWGIAGFNVDYNVMRKQLTDPEWRPSDNGSQPVKGIYFSFGALGINAGQTIYGYSIFPSDVTGSGTGLVNWLNYLNNTPDPGSSSTPATGIDLMAGGGIFISHTISGTVFQDTDGSKLQDNGEVGTALSAPNDLKAVLIETSVNGSVTTNKVLQVVPISPSNGTYKFNVAANKIPGFADTSYKIVITKDNPTPGSIAAVTSNLPTGYQNTGENKNGVIDATVDGSQTLYISGLDPITGQPGITNTPNVDFGIQKPPIAVAVDVPSQANPGGIATVNIPPGSFNTSTDDGTVAKYRITAFPTNVTSITIGTTTYTSANFPTATGVTVLATDLNTIKIDPVDGAITATILFKAIDNANAESTNTATISVPFTATVTGTPPELILLKRITKINGGTLGKARNGSAIDLTQVVAQPDNPLTARNESGDATNPLNLAGNPTNIQWPTVNYPQGSIDAGVIKTGDAIEYTIYFLSIGGKPVANANLCDWVPKDTVFEPNSYGLGKGIQMAIGSILTNLVNLTNVPDGDQGEFLNPGVTTGSTRLIPCRTPAGSEGAVVVSLIHNGTAPQNQLPNATAGNTPATSYGLIRFVSKVK